MDRSYDKKEIWHGESSLASWTHTGGNLANVETGDDQDASNMFDTTTINGFTTADSATFWHGANPVTEQNTITITFSEQVTIFFAEILTANVLDNALYQELCFILDEYMSFCTSDEHLNDGIEMFKLGPIEPVAAKSVKLVFKEENYAAISDLKIHYTPGNEWNIIH